MYADLFVREHSFRAFITMLFPGNNNGCHRRRPVNERVLFERLWRGTFQAIVAEQGIGPSSGSSVHPRVNITGHSPAPSRLAIMGLGRRRGRDGIGGTPCTAAGQCCCHCLPPPLPLPPPPVPPPPLANFQICLLTPRNSRRTLRSVIRWDNSTYFVVVNTSQAKSISLEFCQWLSRWCWNPASTTAIACWILLQDVEIWK